MLRNVVTHQDGASIHPSMPASRSTTRTKARRPEPVRESDTVRVSWPRKAHAFRQIASTAPISVGRQAPTARPCIRQPTPN